MVEEKVHGGVVGTYSHMQVQVLEVRIDWVTAVTHQCISERVSRLLCCFLRPCFGQLFGELGLIVRLSDGVYDVGLAMAVMSASSLRGHRR